MMISELGQWLEDRERTYLFLARAYRSEPALDFLAGLVAALQEGDLTAESKGYGLLRRWAQGLPSDNLEQAQQVLALEYARLFLTPTEPARVVPYASAYTSPDKMLMQEAARRALAAYRAENIAWNRDASEYPDHLAAEMEFMVHLCGRASQAAEAGDKAACQQSIAKQRHFVEHHLLNWVPRFTADMERVARHDFYRALALITQEVLANELQDLDELAAACSTKRAIPQS